MHRSKFAFFTIINALALFTIEAAPLTWTGTAGDNLMNTPNNWSPTGPPADGDSLIFPSGQTPTITNNVPPPLTLGSSLDILDAYTISGGTFEIAVGGTTLTYGTTSSTVNTAFTLNGPILINSNSASNTLGGQITSTGALTILGSLILSNGSGVTPNNYSGITSVGNSAGASGTLTAGASGAFSSSSNMVLYPGSTLSLVNGGASFNCTIGTLTQGSGTGNSSINLGSGSLTILNSGTITFPGIISASSGGLTVNGSGTLTLTGSNTNFSSQAHQASVTVGSGVILQAGSANAFGSVASGAYVNLNVVGQLNLQGNALIANALNGSGGVDLGGATLTVAGGGTFSGTISGTGVGSGLTVSGGIFTLSHANTFHGPTTLSSGGTLVLQDAGALTNSSSIIFNSGIATLQVDTSGFSFANSVTLSSGSSAVIALGSNDATLGGAIGSSGTFTVQGTGTLTLNGANNYSGQTTISGATLLAGSTSAFGNSSPVLITNAGTLDLNGNDNSIQSLAGGFNSNVFLSTNSSSGTLTITGGSVDDAFYGVIANNGTSAGSVAISGGTVTLMEPNTYTGTTTLSGASTLNTFSLGTTSGLVFSGSGGTVAFGSTSSSSAALTLSSSSVLTPNTFDISLSGNIGGTSGNLFILGPGKVILTGTLAESAASSIHIQGSTLNATNDSLGTVLVSPPPISIDTIGGILQAGENLTIPSTQSITLSGVPGTIDLNSHDVSIAGVITGAGNFIVTDTVGGGTLTLTNIGNNYAGSTSIFNGTLNAVAGAIPNDTITAPVPAQLIFGGFGAPTSSAPIFQCGGNFPTFTPAMVFMSNATIDTNGNAMSSSGVVAGLIANSFTKIGAGTLTFGGANIYKGPTIVNVGTLQAGVASTSTSGAFGVNSAVTVASGATLDLNSFSNTIGSLQGAGSVTLGTAILTITNGNSLTFSGGITGSSGGLTLTQGTFTLSGSNAYSGATTISAGTLQAGSTTALANNSSFVIASGATLNLNNFNNTIANLSGPTGSAVTLGTARLTLSNGGSSTFAGNITGSTGGLTLTTGTQILSGVNSYTGATTINGGTLQAGAANTFASQSAVTIASGGTLSLNGFNNTIKSLTGALGSSVSLGSGVLTIANGSSLTFSGGISGTGGGITLSSGQLTLAGANSYTGPTIVNTGTLIASNGNTSPFGNGSNITVENGGTINFGTINASGVTVGSLQNSANVIANMTAGKLNTTSYAQASNAALSLTLPATPGGSFEAMSSSGDITLKGSLTVTGLSSATAPVVLIHGTGTPNQLSGTFSSSTLPAGFTLQYDYAENQVYLKGGTSGGCNGTWNHNSTANWGDTVNWNPTSCAPGVSNTPANLDTATFPDLSASSISIFLATSGGSGPTVQDITLYDMSFTASTTSYNILSYFGSTITMDGVVSPKPRITVSAGSHALYPPIILNKDSRFSLSGTLTMGLFSSITSSVSTPDSTLFISENDTAGIFNNYGAIAPGNVSIQGCTINNYSTISPTSTLQIEAITGNASSLIVNNYNSMLPATLVINGSASATIVNNIGSGQIIPFIGQITTTSGAITITDATVTNSSGGQIYAADGQTLTINSGSVSNDASSVIGSSASNLSLAGGTLSTSGRVLADNYTQASGSTLQINVKDVANSGNLAVSGTANLGGTLAVNALPGFTLSSTQVISLVTDTNGFASQFSDYALQNFPSSVIPEIVVTPTSIQLATTPVTISHISSSSQILFNAVSQHNSYITRKCYQLKHRLPKVRKEEKVAINKTTEGDIVYMEEQPMFQIAERLPYSPEGHAFELVRSEGEAEYQQVAWNLLPQWMFPKSSEAVIPAELEKQAQLARRIREESQKPFNLYAGPTSSFGSSKSVGSQVGVGYSSVGGLVGFDAILGSPGDGYVSGGIGSVVSYEKLWGTAHHDAGSLNLDKVHGSIYGTILPSKLPELYFEAIAGFAYSWDHLKRKAGFDGSLDARSHTHELIFDALVGVEYTLTNKLIHFFGKSFTMTPLFHLQYAHDHVDGFKERGAGIYNLKVGSQNIQALTSSLGARFDYLFSYSKFNLLIELDAEWQREYLNEKRSVYFIPFNITDLSSPTSISAAARNSGLVGLDVLATLSKGWQLEANGTFQWNHLAYNAFFYLGLGRVF